MLRKIMFLLFIGVLSAAVMPAASPAIEAEADVPVFKYKLTTFDMDSGKKFSFNGTLKSVGEDYAYLQTVEQPIASPDVVKLRRMFFYYSGQDSIIMFSQGAPLNMPGSSVPEAPADGPSLIPFPAIAGGPMGMVRGPKGLTGECYFEAFINLEGDAQYNPNWTIYGGEFNGEGYLLYVVGSAVVDLVGYPEESLIATAAPELVNGEPISEDCTQIKVKLKMTAMDAKVVYVDGEPYWEEAQPVTVTMKPKGLTFMYCVKSRDER